MARTKRATRKKVKDETKNTTAKTKSKTKSKAKAKVEVEVEELEQEQELSEQELSDQELSDQEKPEQEEQEEQEKWTRAPKTNLAVPQNSRLTTPFNSPRSITDFDRTTASVLANKLKEDGCTPIQLIQTLIVWSEDPTNPNPAIGRPCKRLLRELNGELPRYNKRYNNRNRNFHPTDVRFNGNFQRKRSKYGGNKNRDKYNKLKTIQENDIPNGQV